MLVSAGLGEDEVVRTGHDADLRYGDGIYEDVSKSTVGIAKIPVHFDFYKKPVWL